MPQQTIILKVCSSVMPAPTLYTMREIPRSWQIPARQKNLDLRKTGELQFDQRPSSKIEFSTELADVHAVLRLINIA